MAQGKLSYGMHNDRSTFSPETLSADVYRLRAAAILEMIARVNGPSLKATLDHQRSMLAHREEKVAGLTELLEAVVACKALNILCEPTTPILEQLAAETNRRDHLYLAVAALEKELARREAVQPA